MRVRIQQFISNFTGNTSAPVFPTHGEKKKTELRDKVATCTHPLTVIGKQKPQTKLKIHSKCMSRFICPL